MNLIPDWLIYEIKHWWEKNNFSQENGDLRNLLRSHKKLAITIFVICISLLLLQIISAFRSNRTGQIKETRKQWYYDLNTNKLFIAKKGLHVPTNAPSGDLPDGSPAGVRAYVFTYKISTTEPNESEYFIGFLEKPDPNITNPTPPKNFKGSKRWGYGRLIKKVNDPNWTSATTPQGLKIMRTFFSADPNGRSASYYPPPK